LEESLFFSVRHGTSRYREPSSIRKLDHDAEKQAARIGPPEDLVKRVSPCRFGSADQRPAKADFFELLRLDCMPGNVLDPVFRPDELMYFQS